MRIQEGAGTIFFASLLLAAPVQAFDFNSALNKAKEVANAASGFDPTLSDAAEDPDNDGLTNDDEFFWGTSPLEADTDGDEAMPATRKPGSARPLPYLKLRKPRHLWPAPLRSSATCRCPCLLGTVYCSSAHGLQCYG